MARGNSELCNWRQDQDSYIQHLDPCFAHYRPASSFTTISETLGDYSISPFLSSHPFSSSRLLFSYSSSSACPSSSHRRPTSLDHEACPILHSPCSPRTRYSGASSQCPQFEPLPW